VARAAARAEYTDGFEGLTANNPDPQDTEDRLAHLLLLATDLVAGESRAELHRRITQLEEQLAEMLR
jgi:hypothetical protein